MTWWQALLVALTTLVVTKAIDVVIDLVTDKRNFKRRRRENALIEIEELKDKIGIIYEIASNWNDFGSKLKDYVEQFSQESEILGRYNKYPNVAMAARAVVHQCKIVAVAERDHEDELAREKKKMANLFATFISECEAHLDSLA